MVIRGLVDELELKRRCAGAPNDNTWVAICYELPPGQDGLAEGLSAQRTLTQVLRAVFGAKAEYIPVFVASDRDGERTEDCVRDWGATEVDD